MNEVRACSSCGRSLTWLRHATTGRIAPIEFAPAENGNIVCVDDEGDPTVITSAVAYRIRKKAELWNVAKDGPLFINHFANCPAAARFHRQRGAA